jgi:hypothetical protein
MTKDAIRYNGLLTAQQYLELITNKYYCLNADNQLEEVERILEKEFGEGTLWSFALDDIGEVMENDHIVVLVEIVNIVMKDDTAKQEKLHRWFELPADWTKEEISKRIEEL